MKTIVLNFPWIYVSITVASYFLGPWGFFESSPLFNIYLIACVCAIYLGGFVGCRAAAPGFSPVGLVDGFRLYKAAVWVSLAIAIPTTFARTGEFIPDVAFGLLNPGEAYQRGIAPVLPQIEYIRLVLAPILFCALPLGVVYWEKSGRINQIAYVVLIIHTFALFVAMGVNRGLFDTVFGIAFAYAVNSIRRGNYSNRRLARIAIFMLPLLIAAIAFFVRGQLSRAGSGAGSGYFPAADRYSLIDPGKADGELGMFAAVLINQVTIYLTQGYYGASIVFDHGISQITYGFGHSDFLLRNGAKLFGDDVLQFSPVYQIEGSRGWLHGNFWFSVLPWVASDVGFTGALVIFFFLSFLYCSEIRRFIASGDWVALMVGYIIFYVFLYFSANNYIFQSGESFIAGYFFLGICGLRVLRRAVGHASNRKFSQVPAGRTEG